MLQEFDVVPIDCLWVEPDDLIRNIIAMKDESSSNWLYAKTPLDLKNVYFPAPPNGGRHLPRFAVWQPRNMTSNSVLVPNYGDGLIQLMRHLNRRFKIRYFSAYLARDHKKQGFCRFESASESGARRIVHVIRDPQWKFFEEGDVLPFENIDHYKSERIADRLTPTIVTEYLKSLGWDLEQDDFWKSRSDAWLAAQTTFKK